MTGNIWAQQWGNIYGLVEPFPNSSVVNVTKVLIDQVCTVSLQSGSQAILPIAIGVM